jgi:tetratricopeptide (TPR) repeat protein
MPPSPSDEASAVFRSVFFSRAWSLEEQLDSEPPMGSALARAVLRLGEGLPLADRFRGARRNGRIQVERASLLLREALRRAREGITLNRNESWRFIHEEWTALCRSAPARAFLQGLAVSAGIPEWKVEEEVDAFLGAIRNELLPGVHALFHAGLATGARGRERFHLERWWTAMRHGAQVSPVLTSALLTCLLPSAREAVQKQEYPEALDLFEKALKALPPSWSRELLGHEAFLAAKPWVASQKYASRTALTAALKRLERLGALVPHDFGLRQLRGTVHIYLATRLIQEERLFSDGALHLVKAQLLDPLTPLANRLLPQTGELLSKVYAQVLTARQQGHSLNTQGWRFLREGKRGLGPILAFDESPAGRKLAQEARTALQGEAMLRLGLLPSEAAAPAAMEAVYATFGRKVGSSGDAPREWLCREHPLLKDIRWKELEELRECGLPVCPEVLALSLPPLPRFSLDEASVELLSTGWRRTCEQGLAAGASSGTKAIDRWVFHPWLFSSRDWLAKGAAVVGSLLVMVGMAGLSIQAWDQSRREEAIQRFVIAKQAGEPSRMAEAARDFLAWDSAGRDPRLEQVAQEYRDALLRNAIHAARTGDSEQFQRLSRESDTLEARLEQLSAQGGTP